MKIAIKYCGGCNPRIRRKRIVNKVKDKCRESNFETSNAEKNYDLTLGINGCHVACGITEDLKESREVIIIGGLNFNGHRLKGEEEVIEKIVDKVKNKLQKEVIKNGMEK
jgi:hypothetical protein